MRGQSLKGLLFGIYHLHICNYAPFVVFMQCWCFTSCYVPMESQYFVQIQRSMFGIGVRCKVEFPSVFHKIAIRRHSHLGRYSNYLLKNLLLYRVFHDFRA